MGPDVLDLERIDPADVALVGGKAAHLAALVRMGGVVVPPGFCVTADAFRRLVHANPAIGDRIDRLARVDPRDRTAIRRDADGVRRAVEAATMPPGLAAAITEALDRLGPGTACAVRSSATAEDLPTASFAGQHDTELNVVGAVAVLGAIGRCWASLFSERAVAYRAHNGVDHRAVAMAVVVQQLVDAQASGVLFTADPVSGNRRVASVEATLGLGEALVAGRVDADVSTVRDGTILSRTVGAKQHAPTARPGGGTAERPTTPDERARPALTDERVIELVGLGRRIEAHFGRPQDVEWCLTADGFRIVQSRPITTLFPIPDATGGDGGGRVFLSVGHQQMMTDPMKPLGLSLFQLTAIPTMHEAAGRLFVEVTHGLGAPASRAALLDVFGRSDPRIRDALETVLARDGFIPTRPDPEPPAAGTPAGAGPARAPEPIEADPAIVTELVERHRASVAQAARTIEPMAGAALVQAIVDDVHELKRLLVDPQSHQVIMAGMEAAWWLQDRLAEWLGEREAADVLAQSVPHNVTAEMGLALLDVADVVRRHPAVVAYLEAVEDDGFLDGLAALDGGPAARAAFDGFLDRYGMRCPGEIDVTRPRWSERPSALVPLVLGNVRAFAPGAATRRFAAGRQQAERKEVEVLERLRALPDGAEKAAQAKRMIDRVRTFAGYREYPKYSFICRYGTYRQALLREADRLVDAGVLRDADDVGYLTLPELLDVARTGRADHELIERRREAFRSYQALTPPPVITSDGEGITGSHRRDDLPAGALPGVAVSPGTVEGRARVVLDLADADVEPGDVLVTPFTDPSWSPLFVAVAGLVTEVGGLMTHGAVIAREYGLPAVVGVDGATRRIRDGQRIRVHGTDGYVELLEG